MGQIRTRIKKISEENEEIEVDKQVRISSLLLSLPILA